MAAAMASALLTSVSSRFTAAAVNDDHFYAMSVGQLRALISGAGLSHLDCLEKSELVARAREAQASTETTERARRAQEREAARPPSWQDIARAGFVRKVYGIVAAQVALNFVMVAVACWSPLFLNSCLQAQAYAWYGAMALLVGIHKSKQSYPLNYALLTGFTVLEGTSVASICALYYYSGQGNVVASAAVLTAVSFGTLSLYAHRTQTDFSHLRGGLYCGLATLCAVFFCQWLWPSTGLSGPGIWTAYAAVLLFSGFVLYDTDRISKRDGMPLDNYIIGSIELYLDVVNLFLSLLRIFSLSSAKDGAQSKAKDDIKRAFR